MYKPIHFEIYELVPKEIYKKYTEEEILTRFFSIGMLKTIDQLRERFGELTINNWYWNGNRNASGLRVPGSEYYNYKSAHAHGKAFDIISVNYSAQEMRTYIMNNQGEFPYIARIEDNVKWLHIDDINIDARTEIYLFNI